MTDEDHGGHVSLNLVVLYCADPNATADFYEQFGLPFAHEKHGDGPSHRAAILGNGLVLELYPAGNRPVTPARIGFNVGRQHGTVGAERVLRDPDGRVAVITAQAEES